MDWKDEVNDHLKTQNETLIEQNVIIIKMSGKVDLMWKAFVGGITLALLFIAGRFFDVL